MSKSIERSADGSPVIVSEQVERKRQEHHTNAYWGRIAEETAYRIIDYLDGRPNGSAQITQEYLSNYMDVHGWRIEMALADHIGLICQELINRSTGQTAAINSANIENLVMNNERMNNES